MYFEIMMKVTNKEDGEVLITIKTNQFTVLRTMQLNKSKWNIMEYSSK